MLTIDLKNPLVLDHIVPNEIELSKYSRRDIHSNNIVIVICVETEKLPLMLFIRR